MPALEPLRDARAKLETIRDVEQLQRVGLIVALALQRAADLGADRRGVFRERQELGAMAGGAKRREQPLRLRLLAALIESFKGDEVAACSQLVSSASSSSSV